jgi:hypothetical protein
MSTITRPPLQSRWVPKRLARLTVDQYEAMVDSGVFTKRDRFTLINGFLVAKVPKSPRAIPSSPRISSENSRGWSPPAGISGSRMRYDWRFPSRSPTFRSHVETSKTTPIAIQGRPI